MGPVTKPTHKIRVKTRDASGKAADVGAAWQREDGSFLLQLNPGVMLKWDDALLISIFPMTDKRKSGVEIDVAELNEEHPR